MTPVANRSKARGTRYESQVVRYVRLRLEDDRVERRALHGNRDMGDIFGLFVRGHEGIIECKNHAKWGPTDLRKWEIQTDDEMFNANADFAVLVVNVPHAPVGRSLCFLTAASYAKVSGFLTQAEDTRAHDHWVCVTLDELLDVMVGH